MRTYGYFADRYVRIFIGKTVVVPDRIPIAQSDEVRIAKESIQSDGVAVTLFAGILDPDHRSYEYAGWYLLCNARVVLAADKSELTGWSGGTVPAFHSKYIAFAGIAFFHSDGPAKLPWTTTKKGINENLMSIRTRDCAWMQ